MISRIRQYSQSTVDVHRDTPDYARRIGILKKDTNRLTVVSALTAKDKVDYFAFKVDGKTSGIGMSVTTNGGDVRVQILDGKGRDVIADNGTTANALEKFAYDKFLTGHMELDAGTYVIKVTRGDGVLDKVKPNYAIQLTAGKFKNDYDTVEKAAPTIPENLVAPSPVASMLNSSWPQGMLDEYGNLRSNIFDVMA